MQSIKFLIQEKQQLEHDAKSSKNHKHLAYYIQRLNAVSQRIRHFGQRYNVIRVTIEYIEGEFVIRTKTIYYTDCTEQDAIDYTQSLIEVNYKVLTCTAISIPVGKLI